MKLLQNAFVEPELVRPLFCQLESRRRWQLRTDKTSHDTSDGRGDLEEMGDCLWVEQLVLHRQRLLPNPGINEEATYRDLSLSDNYRSVLSSDCNSRYSRSSDCLECIF